jgi:hypothetical protein
MASSKYVSKNLSTSLYTNHTLNSQGQKTKQITCTGKYPYKHVGREGKCREVQAVNTNNLISEPGNWDSRWFGAVA